MKDLVFLDYTFLIDPAATWSHLYEFESALSDFFASRGMEACVMKGPEGQQGRRIMMIEKKEDMPVLEDKPKNVVDAMKDAVKRMK